MKHLKLNCLINTSFHLIIFYSHILKSYFKHMCQYLKYFESIQRVEYSPRMFLLIKKTHATEFIVIY